MEEGQSFLKICVKIGPKKFPVHSNFYDPVEKCKKWTKWTQLHRKYAIESVSHY